MPAAQRPASGLITQQRCPASPTGCSLAFNSALQAAQVSGATAAGGRHPAGRAAGPRTAQALLLLSARTRAAVAGIRVSRPACRCAHADLPLYHFPLPCPCPAHMLFVAPPCNACVSPTSPHTHACHPCIVALCVGALPRCGASLCLPSPTSHPSLLLARTALPAWPAAVPGPACLAPPLPSSDYPLLQRCAQALGRPRITCKQQQLGDGGMVAAARG